MPYTDDELVESAMNGDKVAFGMLVERVQGACLKRALRLLQNREVAEDLTQEAFIKAYKNLDSLKEPAKFRSWLASILDNLCFSWLRKRKVETVSLDDLSHADDIPELTDCATPDVILEQIDLSESVMQAIEALPEKYQVVLTLHYLDGWAYQEIADFLEVPKSTVSGRLQRGKRQLKRLLADNVCS